MTEGATNLTQQIQQQVLKSAQDFYENSLGSLKSQLENDRSQLQELLEQLPDSQEDAHAQLEEWLAAYEAIENSLKEVAQHQGVEHAVNQVTQQTQEAPGQPTEITEATQQAQSITGHATKQAQDERGVPTAADNRWKRVRGAASSTAGRAFGTLGSVAGVGYTKARGLLAREKGPSDNEKDG